MAAQHPLHESVASDREVFLSSYAMLYIHPGGREVYGHFAAYGGKDDPKRTWFVAIGIDPE